MAFQDAPFDAHYIDKQVSGLGVTQAGPMTLQVDTGSVQNFKDGTTCTLGVAQTETFTADATNPTQVLVGLIDDGVNCDVWFDAYIDDGFNTRGNIPNGYTLVVDLAWFTIAANETDILNGTVFRRTWA